MSFNPLYVGEVHLDLCEEDVMSHSDKNASHEAERVEANVDERLSKLSLIARNVTLRLSSPATTKRGSISKKVAGNTQHDANAKESLANSKKIAHVKTLNKVRSADLRSTSVDLTNMTKETEAKEIENDCSESSIQIGKETESSPKAKPSNSRASLLTEQLTTDETFSEDSKQSQQHKTEVEESHVECSDCPKQAEQDTHNCKHSSNTQTNNTRIPHLTEQLITNKIPPKKSNETEKGDSPKETISSRKIPGQTSSVKPRIPFRAIRRRKSTKLGERSVLVRRKSFLKKGDGLAARRQFKMKTNATGGGKMMESGVNEKQADTRGKASLRMPGRKDKTNSTFLLTRNRKLLNKASVCEGSETVKSSSRSRRQWSENGLQVTLI